MLYYTTIMASLNPFEDLDVVQKTRYKVPPTRFAKAPPPEPWPMPDFQPYLINDSHDYGETNLPANIDSNDPFAIFQLFFTEDIMDKLVEWTNQFAELHRPSDKEAPLGNPRAWEPTSRTELYAYFGTLIYMGITTESCVEDYWGDHTEDGASYIVKNYIGKNRF